MKYVFPVISHISDVLPAIEGSPEFVVAERDGYTVINYNVHLPDTFPPVPVNMEWQEPLNRIAFGNYDPTAAIRRECRGVIFCSETGNILRRPYHKFFNVGEKAETQDHVIDLSQPHVILEKLDGSMCVPFYVNGVMAFGTKMGCTDVAIPIENFVNENPKYIDFAAALIHAGWSPIFEWCSRKQRIVIDHPEDTLVLTAIRNIYSGNYMTYNHMDNEAYHFDIPVVRQFDPQTDMKAFIDYTRDLIDTEGFVVRFDDGHMLKLKCDWYVQIHKAKDAMLFDRHIVKMFLDNELDDVIPHLPAEDNARLDDFLERLVYQINSLNHIVYEAAKVEIAVNHGDRKAFALGNAKVYDTLIKSAIFSMWDDCTLDHATSIVEKNVRNSLGSNSKWDEFCDSWLNGVRFNV